MENNKNLIIQKITGLTKSQLFLNPEIPEKFTKEIDIALSRLKSGEPVEYIINNAEFYSLDFYVDKRVLIPRDDTEILVDKSIDEIVKYNNITLIDIGTGSSCIPISILENTEKIKKCYVVDISNEALKVSKINIIQYNLENKITPIHGNLLDKVNNFTLTNNIIITANLPYIKDNDFDNIDKETIEFEPSLALYGGKETGFELYDKLILQCLELKSKPNIKNIILFIEIGFDQKEYSKMYLNNLNLNFEYFKDCQNIDRCIKIEF